MSDGSLLLLVLWIIYLPECLLWVGRHSVIFATPWLRAWSAITAGDLLGSASGSVRLVNPVPPLGRFHRVDLPPFSVSLSHVVAFNPQTISPAGRPVQKGAPVAIEDIREVAVRDTEVRINGRAFVRIADRGLRTALARLLEELRKGPASERAALIEKFWEPRFDLPKAREAVEDARRHSAVLAAACNIQFSLIFVALPALSLLKGLDYVIIPGAIAMEAMAILIAALHFRAHRRLHPEAKGDRVTHLVKTVLCAPLSIRAVDALAASAAGRFHVLTVAEALPQFPGRAEFLGRVLRDLRHPLPPAARSAALDEACRWQGATIERIATRALPGVAALVPALDAPPAAMEKNCRCYCPRCLAQLSIDTTTCPDCPGVAMIPVAAADLQPAGATLP